MLAVFWLQTDIGVVFGIRIQLSRKAESSLAAHSADISAGNQGILPQLQRQIPSPIKIPIIINIIHAPKQAQDNIQHVPAKLLVVFPVVLGAAEDPAGEGAGAFWGFFVAMERFRCCWWWGMPAG